MKRHLELEMKIRFKMLPDADKLRRLLKVKKRQKDEVMYIEDTQIG